MWKKGQKVTDLRLQDSSCTNKSIIRNKKKDPESPQIGTRWQWFKRANASQFLSQKGKVHEVIHND